MQWLIHLNNYAEPNETWNYAAAYYPGPNYVDWLGLSIYGQPVAGDNWSPIEPLITWPYEQMYAVYPMQPIMVAECGLREFPPIASKATFIRDGFTLFRTPHPLLTASFS